jgi:hypothetical protein
VLTRYLGDGFMDIDDNPAELSLRPGYESSSSQLTAFHRPFAFLG